MNNIIEIDWNMLSDISYKTNLGKSLKNTLRKFQKEELFDEISRIISYFTEIEIPKGNKFIHSRVKAMQSCILKYDKFYPSKPVEEVFNDILGLRIIISDYSIFDEIELPPNIKIADMRFGKANDDGYRGIHLYFQKDHFHYPIEVQFMTNEDKIFNAWLHIYTYKYICDSEVGIMLREMYEKGDIASEEDFKEVLENVLSNSKRL
ncbi:MAG: hypothetical protein PHY47_23875 [Lachnospiraceae bacterium]|nr:hypothetical protein [Lachnospiraceae bacterium]